jgi:hypothetical protein
MSRSIRSALLARLITSASPAISTAPFSLSGLHRTGETVPS